MTPKEAELVSDEMVERAWAAIVGEDIAQICHTASIVRGDLKTALTAVLSAREPPSK